MCVCVGVGVGGLVSFLPKICGRNQDFTERSGWGDSLSSDLWSVHNLKILLQKLILWALLYRTIIKDRPEYQSQFMDIQGHNNDLVDAVVDSEISTEIQESDSICEQETYRLIYILLHRIAVRRKRSSSRRKWTWNLFKLRRIWSRKQTPESCKKMSLYWTNNAARVSFWVTFKPYRWIS